MKQRQKTPTYHYMADLKQRKVAKIPTSDREELIKRVKYGWVFITKEAYHRALRPEGFMVFTPIKSNIEGVPTMLSNVVYPPTFFQRRQKAA